MLAAAGTRTARSSPHAAGLPQRAQQQLEQPCIPSTAPEATTGITCH